MAEMKRTTGGLLEGQKKTITGRDFEVAVKYLRAKHLDPSTEKLLGLTAALRYFSASTPRALVRETRSEEVLDLQRATVTAR